MGGKPQRKSEGSENKQRASKRALQRAVRSSIILEHKSYRDNNAIRQMLGYYNAIAQESGGIILPIIVTCCQDKRAVVYSDYLSWALQQQGAPAELRQHFKRLPNFHCLLVNFHALSYRRMRRGGEAVSLALFGMRN